MSRRERRGRECGGLTARCGARVVSGDPHVASEARQPSAMHTVHAEYTPGRIRVHFAVARNRMPHTQTKSVTELLGLPDPPRTGRERLVAAAIELFYRHGFGAV